MQKVTRYVSSLKIKVVQPRRKPIDQLNKTLTTVFAILFTDLRQRLKQKENEKANHLTVTDFIFIHWTAATVLSRYSVYALAAPRCNSTSASDGTSRKIRVIGPNRARLNRIRTNSIISDKFDAIKLNKPEYCIHQIQRRHQHK